jgi:putative ABC transport system permease protein
MLLETIWMDVRYAFRATRKSPGFTAVAVLSLALGIGATTAIFSVVDALMLRPLPVTDPQRLVLVAWPGGGLFSYRVWQQIRDQQDVFSGVFAYMQTTLAVATGGEKQSIPGIYVSGDYFNTLGVSAIRGRTLLSSDDQRGASLVCVISYGFWERQFAKAPGVIGKTLTLDGQEFEVVGVTPPSFFGLDVGETFDAMVPLESERIVDARQSAINAPQSIWWKLPSVGSALDADTKSLIVGGRLKPGIDAERASARFGILAPAIFEAAFPPKADDETRQRALRRTMVVYAIPNGISFTRETYGEAITLMMVMAGIVLVIACANLANLLLARSTTRQRELATRLAHGASRWRLVRQVLTESLVLSALGAAIGIVIARWGGKLLMTAICTSIGGPVGTDAQYLFLPFDLRFLGFTAVAAILSALLFGLAPALQASHLSPYLTMKIGPTGLTRRRGSSRSLLIIAQVALSMTVLVGAGLLVRTIQKLMAQDQGYDPKGVLTVQASLAGGDDSPKRQAFLARELLAKFRSLPGVVSAARYASAHMTSMKPNVIAQSPGGPESRILSVFILASPGYFQTLHAPLFAGRDFSEEDTATSPAVAILSETAAGRFFPGMNPLGLTFRQVDEGTGQQSSVKVVGITKDRQELVRSSGQPYPMVFRPIAQCSSPCPLFGTYALRFVGPLYNITVSAKDAARDTDSHLALEFRLESDIANEGYQRDRMSAMLAMLFGALTLILGAIGIYGVTSYATAQRTTEIGVRISLGAQRRDILRLIVGGSFRLVLIGVAFGAMGAFSASRLIREMLFGVTPADPVAFTLAAALIVMIALIGALLPAFRALKTDPIVALRAE